MSTDRALNFCFKKQATEDFMKMIRILANVKPLLEETVEVNKKKKEYKNSIEFIKQDLKTLENAKNAVLDEEVVTYMENFIKKKREELSEKDSEKNNIINRGIEIIEQYRDFEFYAKMVKVIYDSVHNDLSINIDSLTTEELLAFSFANISFDPEIVEESSCKANYDEANDILIKGIKSKEELFGRT